MFHFKVFIEGSDGEIALLEIELSVIRLASLQRHNWTVVQDWLAILALINENKIEL